MWTIIIQILSKLGFFSAAQRVGIKAGMGVVHIAEEAKVEYSYPIGKNGLREKKFVANGQPNGNFNKN